MPPKNASGTDMTRAHGQDITRKVQALSIQSPKFPVKSPDIIGGRNASTTAAITTAGVYTLANLVIKFSVTDFLDDASSTSSSI